MVTKIGDKLRDYFKINDFYIYPINILHLVPMLIRKGIITDGLIETFFFVNNFIIYKRKKFEEMYTIEEINILAADLTLITIDDPDDISRINQEKLIADQLLKIFEYIHVKDLPIPEDIYALISLAHTLDIKDGIINKIIYHIDVNPLLASIYSKNIPLIKGFFTNKRSY